LPTVLLNGVRRSSSRKRTTPLHLLGEAKEGGAMISLFIGLLIFALVGFATEKKQKDRRNKNYADHFED
jgi:hypothetical protein